MGLPRYVKQPLLPPVQSDYASALGEEEEDDRAGNNKAVASGKNRVHGEPSAR
jgi:hypothetical protein